MKCIVGALFWGSKIERILLEESFEEFKELIRNLGLEIVGEFFQSKPPHPGHYFGRGKLEEVKKEVEKLGAEVLAIDGFLKGSQIMEIMNITGLDVWDREYVIIKIFSERARTYEAQLQVKLAELRYKLAKLQGLGVMLSRLGGGAGTRGPGEQKTEEIRRHIKDEIKRIQRKLEEIKSQRGRFREARRKKGFFEFSLVGYTNAGKSTLLKRLTGEDVVIKDQYFTTLDTRTGKLINHDKILIADTVGFIRNIPRNLLKAFHSTLEEIIFSDAIIKVIDISRDIDFQIETIDKVLKEIGAGDKPSILVFNKIDIVDEYKKFENAIFISALKGYGIEKLIEEMKRISNINEEIERILDEKGEETKHAS